MAAPSKNYAEATAAMVDIHAANYAAYFTPFGAAAAQPAPATLRDTVANASNSYPKVFVIITEDPPVVSCLLRTTRFTAPLGVTTPWTNRIFCLNGDISAHGHPSIINWPANAFARCAAVHVPTTAEVNTQWMANPAAESLGPFAAGTANTEEVQCRFACPLPSKYAALALRKQRRTPREFWHEVIHAVEADGNRVACAVLLIWARMACTLCTLPAGAGNQISNVADELDAPVADGSLLDFVGEWIRVDLPDRAPVANAIGFQQQLIAHQAQLANLVANQQLATAAAAAPKVKTVAEAYPAFIDSLQKYCNAADENALPPLYNHMANSKRQEQVVVVEYALAARADQVGWAPPVASPEVVQMIVRMQFTSVDMDDLTAGLSPFLIVGANEARAGGVRTRQYVYSMVNAGNVAPNLDQLSRLVDTAPQMAQDLVSLLTILRAYSILLDVLLGVQHPLAEAYRTFVRQWDQQAQPTINGVFNATEILGLMPLFQRRLQLETQYWLNRVPLTAPGVFPPLPDYDGILQDVALRFWNKFQQIPNRYTTTDLPPAVPLLPAANNGGPPPRVMPPPLVVPPPVPAPPRQPSANAVTNPTPNAALIAWYGRYGGRLRVLTAQLRDQLPMADDGSNQLCLAYCMTGNCNTNCHRRGTHRPLTSTEEGRVMAFLTAGNVE